MARNEIAVVEGNLFLVSNLVGDIEPGTPQGLYCADTRFLSRFALRLAGQSPLALSADNVEHHAATFYMTNPAVKGLPSGSLTIVRDRQICDKVQEELTLLNHTGRALHIRLTLDFAADFADIFEVRGAVVPHPAPVAATVTAEGGLAFTAHYPAFECQTLVDFSEPPAISGTQASFTLALPPHGETSLAISITPLMDGTPAIPARPYRALPVSPTAARPADELVQPAAVQSAEVDTWVAALPRLSTPHVALSLAYGRTLRDLAGLRMNVRADEGYYLPAAGLPWYMALFGRDALITSIQTLLLEPDLSVGTLRVLADYQARQQDEFRDEEPGKIPHEVRAGRLAALSEVPHARYYGSVDATPLYLMLLRETYRWTGDLMLVRQLLPVAEAALGWLERYGDLDGDGFVEYLRHSRLGLRNQGWKDSEDAICFADGTLAEGPIALIEVQAYVYAAKTGLAELYQLLGQPERASQLEKEASALRAQLNDAFWMPDERYFAVALDGRKRQVDSITSNPGHCLWAGALEPDRAAAVAERLLADDLFSGWGVRTMSAAMGAYNPISYHNGSVWPHDNSLIAAGLARYGFNTDAERIIWGILDASAHFPAHRLPELFAGYERRPAGFPVDYPGANAPQAWAAGAVVLMLQTLLGLSPGDERLLVSPLPGVPALTLEGVWYRGRRLDVSSASRRTPVAV